MKTYPLPAYMQRFFTERLATQLLELTRFRRQYWEREDRRFLNAINPSTVTGRNEPAPGPDFHPLWTSAFARRTFASRLTTEQTASN